MSKRSPPSRALVQALEAVQHATNDLDNAAGVTGQFTAELRRLRETVARADWALGKGRRGASIRKRIQQTASRTAYLAQVLILLGGDSESEACDALSGLLTHNGIYGEDSGILDWSYRFEGREYLHPKAVRIPADFAPDTLELHNLSGAEGGAS